MKNKGFTIIEYMIITVIIGLLAAMAIRACQKIHENYVIEKGKRGQILSIDDQAIYDSWKMANPASANGITKYNTITIDGRTYYLVPVSQ